MDQIAFLMCAGNELAGYFVRFLPDRKYLHRMEKRTRSLRGFRFIEIVKM